MKHFNWMVFDGIDDWGIWFKGTKNHFAYCLYWNPLRTIKALRSGNWSFGFFPLSKNHIKGDWK